jgi:glutathione S-transferase
LDRTSCQLLLQSSAIIYYLLKTYDPSSKFSANDPLRDEILTSFAGATFGPLLTLELVLDLAAKHTPWPFIYLPRFLRKQMQDKFTTKELKNALIFLEQELGAGEYFNGKEIGRSDVMISWPLDTISARNWYVLILRATTSGAFGLTKRTKRTGC